MPTCEVAATGCVMKEPGGGDLAGPGAEEQSHGPLQTQAHVEDQARQPHANADRTWFPQEKPDLQALCGLSSF